MMLFPLYVLRKYREISIEGDYKIITTAKSRYVLDFAVVTDPSYTSRRIELLRRHLPYKLYPISYVLREPKDLIGRSCTLVYTDSGKIHKYKASRYYDLKSELIESSWVTDEGYSVIKVRGIASVFKTNKYNKEKYAVIAVLDLKEYLIGFSDTKELKSKRIKI